MSDNSLEKMLGEISSNPELMEKISSAVNNDSGDMEKTLSSVISLISSASLRDTSSSPQSKSTYEKVEPYEEKVHSNTDTPLEKITKEENSFDKNQLSFLNTFASSISKNSDFLLALKPYLNKERREIIDNVVRMSKLASIVNLAK